MDSKEKYESKLNAWKFQVVAVTVLLVILHVQLLDY